jgi:cytochrome c oxidase subunit 2
MSWWFPAPASEYARSFDSHFAVTFGVSMAVLALAQIALVWMAVRYRDRGQTPSAVEGSTKLEVLWTVGTAVVFLGLWAGGNAIWAGLRQPERADVEVEVSAKQFAWAYRYPGRDGKLGATRLDLINDAEGNPVGLDRSDPAAKDDVVAGMLRVPAGRSVRLTLVARDVIHNFFVRELRIKQDAVPGLRTTLSFTADKPGEYEIACSELCGLGHHQMRSILHVMPAAEFDRWIEGAK